MDNDDTAERDRLRMDEWREFCAKRIAITETCAGYRTYVPHETVERATGMTMLDICLDHLSRARGLGRTPDELERAGLSCAADRRREDLRSDGLSARARRSHSRMVARDAALWCEWDNCTPFAGDDLERFVKRFYRAGDIGLHAAVRRALVHAMA